MERRHARRDEVLERVARAGGLAPEVSREVSAATGVPEADVYGAASFYTLLREPGVARVCQGLSCRLAGADGTGGVAVSCLAQCDRAPAALDGALELIPGAAEGGVTPDDEGLPVNLGGPDAVGGAALSRARARGVDAVLAELEVSGLQGRGGAGFPAHVKWRAVRGQADPVRYVVVNADEGEPGTFKDREVLLRRPHRLVEGLAIAAWAVGAEAAYVYLRGELREAGRRLAAALREAAPYLDGLAVHVHEGHGAYICGEETALLESLEGRRGMPRLKPPFPTERGLWGRPTLIHNVETLAMLPWIVQHGGAAFRALGRGEPGTKLYCISGHVVRPGVYELPLGATLDALVAAAGGYVGTPRAFSPGGASSGFLPMSERGRPLTFRALAEVGSMLGSAGVVVLNDTVDLVAAVQWQQVFFEDETCGQCAPCRIGCRVQRQAIDRFAATRDPGALAHVAEVAWEMEEGSICGLGMVASAPLVSAMKHFPDHFGRPVGRAR